MQQPVFDRNVRRFLAEEIDTIPQIEALLLLWESRPRLSRPSELLRRLYVSDDAVGPLLAPLVIRRLVYAEHSPIEQYSYLSRGKGADELMEAVTAPTGITCVPRPQSYTARLRAP